MYEFESRWTRGMKSRWTDYLDEPTLPRKSVWSCAHDWSELIVDVAKKLRQMQAKLVWIFTPKTLGNFGQSNSRFFYLHFVNSQLFSLYLLGPNTQTQKANFLLHTKKRRPFWDTISVLLEFEIEVSVEFNLNLFNLNWIQWVAATANCYLISACVFNFSVVKRLEKILSWQPVKQKKRGGKFSGKWTVKRNSVVHNFTLFN